MKLRLVSSLIIIVMIGLFSQYVCNHKDKGYYPSTMIVEHLDYSNDTVVLRDSVGFIWEFNGTEDWVIGDVASVLLYDNGTDVVFDDEICRVYYSGFLAKEMGWFD